MMKDVPNDADQEDKENTIRDIINNFEDSMAKATKEGLLVSGKLQLVLKQESNDQSMTDTYLAKVKPMIEEAVTPVMNRLQAKGFAAPGAVHEMWLFRMVYGEARQQGHRFYGTYVNTYVNDNLQKLLGLEKSLPQLSSASQMTQSIQSKMQEMILEEVNGYRQLNPQLNDCNANILAATVVGALKADVKSAVDKYVKDSGAQSVDESQDVEEAVTKQIDSLLVSTLEMEGMEQHSFEDGAFTDASSDAFGDVKARIQSYIQAIIKKQLEMHRNQK